MIAKTLSKNASNSLLHWVQEDHLRPLNMIVRNL